MSPGSDRGALGGFLAVHPHAALQYFDLRRRYAGGQQQRGAQRRRRNEKTAPVRDIASRAPSLETHACSFPRWKNDSAYSRSVMRAVHRFSAVLAAA